MVGFFPGLNPVRSASDLGIAGNCPFSNPGWERVAEIRVLRAAAVARPITGVHGELHQVGKPSDLLGACRFTARQRAKLIQIDGIPTLRNQVGVDELEMADLILGIVVDILGHVPIQYLQGSRVAWTPAPP